MAFTIKPIVKGIKTLDKEFKKERVKIARLRTKTFTKAGKRLRSALRSRGTKKFKKFSPWMKQGFAYKNIQKPFPQLVLYMKWPQRQFIWPHIHNRYMRPNRGRDAAIFILNEQYKTRAKGNVIRQIDESWSTGSINTPADTSRVNFMPYAPEKYFFRVGDPLADPHSNTEFELRGPKTDGKAIGLLFDRPEKFKYENKRFDAYLLFPRWGNKILRAYLRRAGFRL